MRAPRREFRVGDRIPADAFFPKIVCPTCREAFAAFGYQLDGEVRCACGALLGEVRDGVRIK